MLTIPVGLIVIKKGHLEKYERKNILKFIEFIYFLMYS